MEIGRSDLKAKSQKVISINSTSHKTEKRKSHVVI